MADYEIWLTDSVGNQIAPPLDKTRDFTYTHSTHAPGFFSITLPGTFPREQIDQTRRVLFFRKAAPGSIAALDFSGFVRPFRTKGARENKQRIVSGYGPNWLLAGRIVYATAGSAQAQQTDYADDLMKAVVTYQMGASAAAARQYNSAYFSVQTDSSSGPSITKGFAYQNVLDVLRELSETARQAGTETFFHLKAIGVNKFIFVTSTAQLGQDLRNSGLVFSDENGNLANPDMLEDWGNEANFAYGLGGGPGPVREILTAEATDRSGATWYARREISRDARNQKTAGVTAAAQAALVAARPIVSFSGDIVSTAGCLYGVNWGFGDRVTVSYDGRQFDALIRSVTVSVNEQGAEHVTARLEVYL